MVASESGIDVCRVDAMIMLVKSRTAVRVHVCVHAMCIHISIPVTHLGLVVLSRRRMEVLLTHRRERLHHRIRRERVEVLLLLLLTCNSYSSCLHPVSPHPHPNTHIRVRVHIHVNIRLAFAFSPCKIQRRRRHPPPQHIRISIHIPTRLCMRTHDILLRRRIPSLSLRRTPTPIRTTIRREIIINLRRTVRRKMLGHILVGMIPPNTNCRRSSVRIRSTVSMVERRPIRAERIEERRHRRIHALRQMCIRDGMVMVVWARGLGPRGCVRAGDRDGDRDGAAGGEGVVHCEGRGRLHVRVCVRHCHRRVLVCVCVPRVERAGEVGVEVEVECGEWGHVRWGLVMWVEVGSWREGDSLGMEVGIGSRAEELVLAAEVEQGGLCDGDACRRLVAIFGHTFGTLGGER
jgi:hypothetical protein